MINPFFTEADLAVDFNTYAANHGVDTEMLASLETLAQHPEAVAAMQRLCREWSEQHRVSAVQASGGHEWLERIGRWKALQEFADSLTVRVDNLRELQDSYRDAQTRRLRNH